MEATPEQSAEGLSIVRVLSSVLDRLVCANASIAMADPGQVTKFHAMKRPGINVQQYLERIHKYASCSNECFILALIYIDRLIQRNNFLLTELNVHRVVITAVLMAAKFFDDAYYNNAYYAKVGGVLVSEMNGLEVDFLFRINFSLHVTPEVFEKYRAELVSQSTTTPSVMSPPLATVQVPQQIHHEPMQVQPAMPAPVPTVITSAPMCSTEVARTISQITPSPPREAAQMIDTGVPMQTSADDSMLSGSDASLVEMFVQDAAFMPLERTSSMPVPVRPVPLPSFHRSQSSSMGTNCAQGLQPKPTMIPGGGGMYAESSFAALQNTIHPLRMGTLVHYNHSEFQPDGVPPPVGNGYGTGTDGPQHMLTGVSSGAGL